MFAYLLILVAIASRAVAYSHPDLLNFTAIGAALLYFGARRPLREAAVPVALLAGTDYLLTVFAYGYPFHVGSYLITWLWYFGIIALGAKMLLGRAGALRVGGAAVSSSTSFFLLSNFAVWIGTFMYPHTVEGLAACFAAALPFYRNDLVSTLLISAVLFGVPALIRQAKSPRPSTPAAI